MKLLSHIIRIIVGLVFILSGLAKLYPIEPFESTFVELGVGNWLLAPFIARFVIALEIFLGLLIIFNLWIKNKVYYLAQGVLIFFTIYLVYLLVTRGNNVDCGCFGSLIEFSPLESILKNLILVIILFLIPRHYYSTGIGYGLSLITAISLSLPIILNPIGIHNMQSVKVNEKIDFTELPPTYKSDNKVDFSKGKKIVAFFTWTCPHCINASRKLASLNINKTNLFAVIGSKKEKGLLEFIEKTKCDFPIIWIDNDDFFKHSGGRLPAIVYIEDGVIKKKWFGDLFDVEEVKQYLQ